jgi:UDP-3-O-[3-hydroxymyristoyl] glucosamine N-acyltransferase
MNSIIERGARIGANVTIGDFTTIKNNVTINDNCVIGNNCIIGHPSITSGQRQVIINSNSHIRSHTVIYEGCQFGESLETGHFVVVRENSICGKNLRLGSYCDLEGDLTIGDYTRLHSDVNVGKDSRIGDFVWIFPRVQFTNDPLPPSKICSGVSIKDMSVVMANVTLFPGVTIGSGAVIGAASVVKDDIPDIIFATGVPAKGLCRIDQIRDNLYGLRYPWPIHFRENYPEKSFALMDEVLENINYLIKTARSA